MTEKEKMMLGEAYLGWDIELVKDRDKAKELCFQLNQTSPSKREERLAIVKELFGKVGKNPWIESSFHCDYGSHIMVGDNFYANHHCVILDSANVIMGNDVLLGPNIGMYTPNHPFTTKERREGYETAKPITIGNDVWMGGNVTILGGATIGNNVIIGAGSVVTKDIPSDVIAVGNPCKVIRMLEE